MTFPVPRAKDPGSLAPRSLGTGQRPPALLLIPNSGVRDRCQGGRASTDHWENLMSTLHDLPVLTFLPDDQAEAVAAVLAHLRTVPGVKAFLTYMPGENDPHIMGTDFHGQWFAVTVRPAKATHAFEHLTLSAVDLAWFRARAFGHMNELRLDAPVRLDLAAVARTGDFYSISIRQGV